LINHAVVPAGSGAEAVPAYRPSPSSVPGWPLPLAS
jgi:hypothetical protein